MESARTKAANQKFAFPTIGSEYAMQGITNQLFAARYQLYMPKREELQAQLDKMLNSE